MRIIIMGTGPFAIPAAQRLLADGHDIPLVVTRPLVDPTAKKLPPRPAFDWATQSGLAVFEPASINDAETVETLRGYAADLFFVCDYGQILSRECLTASRCGGINLHGSILPRHRGAAPVQWAVLRGDIVTGVTVIHMTPKLDGGPALSVAKTEILPDETAEQLEPRLAKIGVAATVEAVDQLTHWDGKSAVGAVQDQALVTRAPRFAKSHGQLDFRLSADYLTRLIRACQPWPGTYAELRWPMESADSDQPKKQLRIIARSARFLPADVPASQLGRINAVLEDAPGSVAQLTLADIAEAVGASPDNSIGWTDPSWGEMLAVRCGAGVLLINRLQPAGKRAMDAREFLRGHPLEVGCHFQLPESPIAALCE